GLHHLVWEVVDNSIDEAMAGHAKHINVTLLPNHRVEVRDDGRGIPVDIHPTQKISALEVVMTILHAGGKFGGDGYKISGGLHGVGVSVVNALSIYTKAEVHRDGKIWEQEYKYGVPQKKVKEIGKCKDTGTIITFEPDKTIFETLDFEWKIIIDHLRQHTYLTKGVHMTISDQRGDEERAKDLTALNFPNRTYQFYFEGGVASYIRYINQNKEVKNENIFYIEKEVEGVNVEIALQYSNEYTESLFAFTNNIYNPDGGTHVAGFRTALTRCVNTYARNKGYLKEKDPNLTGDDAREGLNVVISIKIREPQFEGQTKGKLGNTEAKTAVEAVLGDAFMIFLEEHPKDGEAIVGKCVLAAKARAAAKIARDTILRKGALEGFTLPGKLADCSSRRAEDSELFIVEGDSAGGCFSGDTKVALADGRHLSFLELIEETKTGRENYCYTIKADGSIGLEKILSPRETKANAEVIEVALDNGETVTCTPDHRFMLRDGSYKPAAQLTKNDSLMPLYRQTSRLGKRITIAGYELVRDPKENRWIFTHLLADEYNLAQGTYSINDGTHRHHVDYNKRNNNPKNIKRLTKEGHLQIHRDHVDKTLRRPDVIAKMLAAKKSPAYRSKMSAAMKKIAPLLRARAKKQWSDPAYKDYMKEKFLTFYKTNEVYRKKNNALLNEEQFKYWADKTHRQKQAERVTAFFEKHPERREALQAEATEQWKNVDLRVWRAEKTKAQWDNSFRAKRKRAYDQVYLQHSLKLLSDVYKTNGTIENYDMVRRSIKANKNYLKLSTIIQRFFKNDQKELLAAVQNYNHRIVSIKKLTKRIPVYDIEVPNTHNFALANGVFVHNSAKQGRDREHQAILPLRGKVLNVERARLDKILTNNELKSLIIAMGTNIGEQFDITKLRYHRIVIMTDADVDGAHIRTLLLTFFYRYYVELLKNGHIYIAQPPLYSLKYGKEMFYAYNDEEKAKVLKDLENRKVAKAETKKAAKNDKEIVEGEGENESEADKAVEAEEKQAIMIGGTKVNIQRYKGLGEMNPDQLWDTTMDPKNRMMKLVTVDDAEAANETFEILMGDEVEPRKKFIQTYAKSVQNLDI
ncbi:MAG: hypothetical protein A3D53_00305, partial [Candidatus Magasanikbacteria bacterium RIFCSPHIGHO2_02_FULL_45_10]